MQTVLAPLAAPLRPSLFSEPRTANNSERSGCYFRSETAGNPGFPRWTGCGSLIISWKNSENSEHANASRGVLSVPSEIQVRRAAKSMRGSMTM
jgi:hypothetical protein